MAYLVLAVGGLTTAIGLFLLATGFPVIEIERGWATVIAGATLTAGGLVTTSLGLVLQSLAGLRRIMGHRAAGNASPASIEPSPPAQILPLPASPPASPSAMAVAEEPEHKGADQSAPSGVIFDAPAREPEYHEPASATLAPEMTATPAMEAAHYVEEEMPLERHGTAPAPIAAPVHPIGGTTPEPTVPAAPEADVPHIAHEPAPAPAPDVPDWRDEAPTAPSEPLAEAPRLDEPAAEPLLPSEPTSAVIGRYEADGTSYVMYADGSIEAQSPAGVYRFASMAELKSFIEG